MAAIKQTHFERPVRIFVRNNSDLTFKDRFDGEDFEIKPGCYIDMPPEAAKLCFGVGDDDRRRVIQRLGWAGTENQMQEALDRLNKFSFHGSEEEAEAHGKEPVPVPVVADKTYSGGGDAPVGSQMHKSLLGKFARAQQAPA